MKMKAPLTILSSLSLLMAPLSVNAARSLSVAETSEAWKTFTSDQSGFSVDLPASPEHLKQKIDLPNTKISIEYDTFISEPSDSVVYVVSVWNYPADIDMSNPQDNLKDGFDGMLAALPGSKVIKSDMTDLQGFKALEFLVKNDDIFFQGKLLIVYNTLYQVFTVYKENVDMKKNYDQFSRSFKLLNPSKQKMKVDSSKDNAQRLKI